MVRVITKTNQITNGKRQPNLIDEKKAKKRLKLKKMKELLKRQKLIKEQKKLLKMKKDNALKDSLKDQLDLSSSSSYDDSDYASDNSDSFSLSDYDDNVRDPVRDPLDKKENPFDNLLNLDNLKPNNSLNDIDNGRKNKDLLNNTTTSSNLPNDDLRIDIMKRDYVNICSQIHLLSKSINISKQDKQKLPNLIYYYIKYFLYSCCIKKKPIFDWLDEFKDKIHIY